MKKYYISIIWIISILLTASSTGLFFYDYYKSKNFICNGEYTIAFERGSISFFTRYIFSDGKGQLDSTGVITDEKQQKINFTRSMKFSYRKMNDVLVLISHDDNPNAGIMDKFSPEIPEFFNYRHRPLVFKMYNTGASRMILTQAGTPFLFCKKE